MTSVVTGASGHLGVNLIRMLLDRGESVRAVVHRRTEPLAGLDAEQVVGDVTDPASLAAAFDGADVVYHLAGVISLTGDPDGRVWSVNADGADTAARIALERGVTRFVHCSSVHAFDLDTADGMLDETHARVPPGSTRHAAYDRSKAEGERRVRHWIERGLDAVIVHPTSVIGPHDHEPSRMGRVFLALARRSLPGLVAGMFDFVDVRDTAAGLIASAERGRTGESYLLGGHLLTVTELARLAAECTGVRPPRFVSPMWLARAGAPIVSRYAAFRGVEPLYTSESLAALRLDATVDCSKAAAELGHRPRPMTTTISDLYEWFSQTGALVGSEPA